MNRPINVFGNSNSNISGNKIDTSLFEQKPYLRTNYIESNIEEDIDLKNQFRVKNLTDPISIREAASKIYVDIIFNDPSVIKSNNRHPHIDMKYQNIINVGIKDVNSWPEWGNQVTSKLYVDNFVRNSVEESSLLRLDPNEKLNLHEQDSINPNSTLTTSKTKLEVPFKSYVDSKINDPSIIKKQRSY